MSSDANTPKPPSATPLPDLEKLVFALGNFARWKMLRELSDGDTRTIRELAAAGGCSYDSAVKHLQLLRATGVVMQGRGSLYELQPQYLPTPGQPIVDFGHCMLRFNVGK